MEQWKQDVILSLTFIVFCVIMFIYAEILEGGKFTYELARADRYMQLWLVILAILSLMLLIRALKNRPKDVVPPIWSKLSLFTVGTLIVYLLVMPYLGFFISTTLFLMTLITAYSLSTPHEKKTGKARFMQFGTWFAVSLLTTTVTYYLFTQVLTVILPKFSLL